MFNILNRYTLRLLFSQRRTFKNNINKQTQQKDFNYLRKIATIQYNQKIKELKKAASIQNPKLLNQEQQQIYQAKIQELIFNKGLVLSKQFQKKIAQIEKQQKLSVVKNYISEGISNQQSKQQKTTKSSNAVYIPNRLILKKLHLGNQKQIVNNKNKILLVGAQKQEDHCLYMSKLIQELNIKNIVTMIAPDQPYFIKTQQSFLQQWKRFLQNPQYAKKAKFYVNPKPQTLNQICLNSTHSPLVRQALTKSKSFLNTHYYMLKQNSLSQMFEPQPLMIGLTNQSVQKIFMASYPAFQQRQMLADSLKLQLLRQLFDQHVSNINKLNFNFNAQWLFPKQILSKKLQHTIKICRTVALSQKGNVMLICPAQLAQLISIQWQLKTNQRYLGFNHYNGQYYLDIFKTKGPQNQTFMEHVEKLVILDIIMEPIMTKYFIKFKSFPSLCEHTLGSQYNIGKIFIIWNHYYNIYYARLTENILLQKSGEKQRKKYLNKFEDPVDLV